MRKMTLKQNLIARIKLNNLYKKYGFDFNVLPYDNGFIISVNDQLIYVSKNDILVDIKWGNFKNFSADHKGIGPHYTQSFLNCQRRAIALHLVNLICHSKANKSLQDWNPQVFA
jgi:hypothetical protein